MQNLFKELAWKCYENHLRFEYIPASNGVNIFDEDYTLIASGFMDNQNVLNRICEEVDEHLEIQSMEDTEFKTDNLTSYERHLKESGHVKGDFYE